MASPRVVYAPPGIFGQMWHNLVTDPALTAAQRACLSTAVRLADLATHTHDTASGATTARDQNWYRVAVGAYTLLDRTDAYRLVDTGLPAAPKLCRVDPARLRAWLHTPADGQGFTVATSLGITDDLDLDHPELLTIVENLVRQAQQAGVFGVPGYTIHAHPVADVDTRPDAHIITLASPAGFALATNPIPPEQLIDNQLAGVEAAVDALTTVAAAVNGLRRGWMLIGVTAAAVLTPPRRSRPARASTLTGPAPSAPIAGSRTPVGAGRDR